MQRKNTIKAFFLLLVFSLQTITSLACSLGFDMGLNCDNHNNEKGTETSGHRHRDCKSQSHFNKRTTHRYNKKTVTEPVHISEGEKKHDQLTSGSSHHQQPNGGFGRNCCNDDIMNVNQPDKERTHFVLDKALFFTAFISLFFDADILIFSKSVKLPVKYFDRCYHPPITDIRIAIQSFQV
jgi:hypothetical protein